MRNTQIIILVVIFVFICACNNENTNGKNTDTSKDNSLKECSCKIQAHVPLWHQIKQSNFIVDMPNGKITDTIFSNIEGEEIALITVMQSQQGWLQINYETSAKHPDITDTMAYTGWIRDSLVYTIAMNFNCDKTGINLYSDSSDTSATVGRLKGGNIASQQEVKILGCCKNWVYVSGVNKEGKEIKGWLPPDKQCSDPFSSCLPCIVSK